MNLPITINYLIHEKHVKFSTWQKTSCQYWIYYLDLPIWNFALSGFNAELDCVIFLYLELDTNHLWVN